MTDPGEVILAVDGSFSHDTTAWSPPNRRDAHLDVAGLWEPPAGPSTRVPILEVEDADREACRRWQVRQIVADPFRWARSLQFLIQECVAARPARH